MLSHVHHQLFPVGIPMERAGVDVVGTSPTTNSGNHWVLMAMDYFTKWPQVNALPKPENIVNAQQRVCSAGSALKSPFTATKADIYCPMWSQPGLHKTRTTPLLPQSDDLVECFNKVFAQQRAMIST